MLDAGRYYLRPRQRIQIFDSDSEDEFQPNKSKTYKKQRGDFNFKSKNESGGHQMEQKGTILRVVVFRRNQKIILYVFWFKWEQENLFSKLNDL